MCSLLLRMEKFIICLKRKRNEAKEPSRPSRSGGFRTSIDLCIHINADAGFQFDGDAVIPDGDLLNPASHQCFVEFCKVRGLLRDVILKIIDSLYLFISCSSIDSGLLSKFSKPENLISYFVVVLFAIGFLNELLL